MKLISISLLLASLLKSAYAQKPGECLDLETRCFGEDGTPCRQIPQRKPDKCGNESVTIEAQWCNNTGKTVRITSESTVKLTGGAVTTINDSTPKFLPLPPPRNLGNGECAEEESWTFEINNCKGFFNYEVNIKTEDDKCRGYFFARQMKTLCRANGKITCTLGDGTPCEDYPGPDIKPIKKEGCPPITCLNQPEETCRQDIDYGFTVRNRDSQELRFDLTSPQIANSKVAFKIVEPNDENFSPLPAGENNSWFIKKENVNVCRVIPSASINILGNIIDPKTNEKDEDYQFCFKFINQKVQKFDDGTKIRPCSHVVQVPAPEPPTHAPTSSPSKGKGGKPKTCPGFAPKVPNDEL